MDAEDLLFREFIGIRRDDETARSAAWIRSNQREDGSWATFYEGPPDLSTSVEAYVALRLAGDPPEAEHMLRAAELIRDLGGVEKARVFTHIWLALFGLWPWDETPAVPAELNLLPSWFPFNPYDFACWARQTIVALSIVASHRPVRTPYRSGSTSSAWTARRSPRSACARRPVCLTLLDAALAAHREAPGEATPPPRAGPGGLVGARAPGGRRWLGRYPTSLGVLPAGAAPGGLRERPSGHGGRHPRPGRFHGGEGRDALPGGLPIARCGTRLSPSWR